MSQTKTILNHMTRGAGITQLTATTQYGITRLAARIGDLRKLGFVVSDRWVLVDNRCGKSCRVKEYFIGGEK